MKIEQHRPTTLDSNEDLKMISGGYTRNQLRDALELIKPDPWARPRLGDAYEQLANIFGK